jgi:hypothetical protein
METDSWKQVLADQFSEINRSLKAISRRHRTRDVSFAVAKRLYTGTAALGAVRTAFKFTEVTAVADPPSVDHVKKQCSGSRDNQRRPR